ncbi:hypothetical protein V1227_06200 [Lentzea sp. DG1S-22]|uniref:hypothetical protein n=1 Tax=Lentzea sp. DG1S-22 TaxID=3108822 RepID=UPI002E759D38|nr:hypothetical protein [Lentzea sp. DG1S-22]WVH82344.1 hypothetical protein V1227_06200 [Lentzea sp. DG1S-22]
MRRRMMTMLASVAVASGVVVGAVGSAAADPDISVVQCLVGGGLPIPESEDGQNLVCLGGAYNGHKVRLPQQPGA